MPATIVDPPASMTCTLGGRSPSSVLERIQTTRPASTRTLASFRNDGPLGSARAASRYKVGRGMIMECPSSSVSRSAFKEGVAEPDQRRVRLEPLCLREECPEPRVAVVLLVGLVIRGDDVKEIILNAGSLLTLAHRADEASLEEPTSAREVVPDRDLLRFEHRFKILRVVGCDSKDDRCRLRPHGTPRILGRRDFGSPRHEPTMPLELLKFQAAVRAEGSVRRRGPGTPGANDPLFLLWNRGESGPERGGRRAFGTPARPHQESPDDEHGSKGSDWPRDRCRRGMPQS